MRALGGGPGRWPAIRKLELNGPIERLDGLAGLVGLEHLDIDAPLDAAQLRSLAGLGLTSLGVRAERLEPALVELFGATLERLELRGCKGSLVPLRQLPRLRSLTLREDQSAQALANLAGLAQLEELSIPSLHDRRTLDALLGLRIRSLHVETLDAELLPAIATLTTLESFSYWEVTGEHVDLTPLLGLARLSALELHPNMQGELELPASIGALVVNGVHEPLQLVGTPTDVFVFDSDPRCLPPSLLLEVRSLMLDWPEAAIVDFLAELPRLCPNLEQLDIMHGVGWQWPEAPRTIANLPQLRRLQLGGGRMRDDAERARAFPELNVNRVLTWPRSDGETPPRTIGVARATHLQQADPDPFAALLAWATELRTVNDRRAELLELELAAELVDDPQQARAHNREANHLRTQLRDAGWLDQLGQAHALIRAATPIHTDASWIRIPTPDHAMSWLRSVDIGPELYAPIPLGEMSRARRLGMRLERLALASAGEDQYTGEALVRTLTDLRQLERLELHRHIPREHLAQLPPLGLRHLALAASNYAPEWINHFAETLSSLQLSSASEPATLDGLALPRLDTLQLGRNWSPTWALERRSLRSLGFCLDASAELPALDWPALEALSLDLHGADASAALRRLLPRVSGLARLRFELDAAPHETLELDLEGMSSLIDLDLDCRGPGPRTLALTLPPSLARLRLSGLPEVAVHGECEQLETSIHALAQLPRELCERARRLTILDRAPPSRTTLERCDALEWLSVSAQALELRPLMTDLEVLPHLRTLVVRGLALSQLPALAQSRPELAIHGVDPGWRDPDRWPLPH